MILTDREIRIALVQKQIVIDPEPDLTIAISSTSIDLTLDNNFATWPQINGLSIRPGAPGYSYAAVAGLQVKQQSPTFALQPGRFVLAWTKQRVNIPYTSRLAARVEGKSSLARLGVSVHVTAPIVHAGFNNRIQLEMFNFGQNEVVLDADMWICQLVFEYTAGTPDKGYSGMFQGN